jgi:transcriptional regulator with XRE-family HTH domain
MSVKRPAVQGDDLYRLIGRRVREARQAAEQSQEALASAVHLTRTSITNLESGRQQVPLQVLYEVASELQCSIYDLIPEKAPPSSGRDFGQEDVERLTAQLAKAGRGPS